MISITADEFRIFSRYVYSICGINLDDSKKYLIETRLSELLQETGAGSYNELYFKIKSDTTKVLQRKIVDAITTRETLFFRDTAPFELLKHKIIPDLIDKKNLARRSNMPIPIRIWSAACSHGQEIYSIAIVLRELLPDLSGYDIRLYGTDISDTAITQASRGIYNGVEIARGLPPDKLARYFTNMGGSWKVRDELRAMATFAKLNLMDPFTNLGRFDIVFCRNVAIYFTEPDKMAVYGKIARVLEPKGYLLLGSTESLTNLCPQFEMKQYLRSMFYQLRV